MGETINISAEIATSSSQFVLAALSSIALILSACISAIIYRGTEKRATNRKIIEFSHQKIVEYWERCLKHEKNSQEFDVAYNMLIVVLPQDDVSFKNKNLLLENYKSKSEDDFSMWKNEMGQAISEFINRVNRISN